MTVDDLIAILEPHRGKQIRVCDTHKWTWGMYAPKIRALQYLPRDIGDHDTVGILKPGDPWIELMIRRQTEYDKNCPIHGLQG